MLAVHFLFESKYMFDVLIFLDTVLKWRIAVKQNLEERHMLPHLPLISMSPGLPKSQSSP